MVISDILAVFIIPENADLDLAPVDELNKRVEILLAPAVDVYTIIADIRFDRIVELNPRTIEVKVAGHRIARMIVDMILGEDLIDLLHAVGIEQLAGALIHNAGRNRELHENGLAVFITVNIVLAHDLSFLSFILLTSNILTCFQIFVNSFFQFF